MKPESKRLSHEDWDKIKILLELKQSTIADISKMYDVSRNSIYLYAKRHDWDIKKKMTFWEKIKLQLRQSLR